MKIKSILNLFIVFTLISTQTILSANEVKYKLEYFYVKNNENILINETTTNTINYSSLSIRNNTIKYATLKEKRRIYPSLFCVLITLQHYF